MSGRSSRSTLIATTLPFTIAAVASSSNDSCAITWHQWQAAYPTDSSTGTSRRCPGPDSSSDQGHQSTGLSACCNRYGLVALLSLFIASILHQSPPPGDTAGSAVLRLPHLDGLDLHRSRARARRRAVI